MKPSEGGKERRNFSFSELDSRMIKFSPSLPHLQPKLTFLNLIDLNELNVIKRNLERLINWMSNP